ncbi:metal-sulfur cluster assembly factor [Thiomonas sp. FB-Cd]|uniref:metal-sulfur cluster assembly factor n=1 Tax=Thiomonas sp. FB-Cd TaxID=1158292 RepID=UPI0004DF4ECB|nr:metal-sulfur cluster assembly factor [Thiomonas sp. FB-Cd]
MNQPSSEEIREALKDVFDPELGYNIVDLGMVYAIKIDEGVVKVTMTLTTPGCPASDMIEGGVTQRLAAIEGVTAVDIDLVWDPRWSPQSMSPAAKEHFGIAAE